MAAEVQDTQWAQVSYRACEIEHRYGANVHILHDPLALTLLARLCQKGTVQPEVNNLVRETYRALVHEVLASELPRRSVAVPTRMIDHTPRGVWRGEAIAAETPVVLAGGDEGLPHHDVLLNLADEWPPFFASFERLLEVVGADEEDRQRARARFAFYRKRGYDINVNAIGEA